MTEIKESDTVAVVLELTAVAVGDHSVKCVYDRAGQVRYIYLPREILGVAKPKAEPRVYRCSCGKVYATPAGKGACVRRKHKARK